VKEENQLLLLIFGVDVFVLDSPDRLIFFLENLKDILD